LVQLPLPKHINEKKVIEALAVHKDVDGFHPTNLGHLYSGNPRLVPCTPLGCMLLLEEAKVKLHGANAVVVGRSTIVGRPMAALLLNADATVTICHRHTKDLAALTKEADVLVVAVGQANLIGAEHIKPGAVIIDVGINRLSDGTLVGDVDAKAVMGKAGVLSPVPGGVGPMTIAMLLRNTLLAYQLRM
jgi:methylenetetrahydrofolate dehydrogenase (NADP+)/methenyltetrahydrofolate cyclohydrolase